MKLICCISLLLLTACGAYHTGYVYSPINKNNKWFNSNDLAVWNQCGECEIRISDIQSYSTKRTALFGIPTASVDPRDKTPTLTIVRKSSNEIDSCSIKMVSFLSNGEEFLAEEVKHFGYEIDGNKYSTCTYYLSENILELEVVEVSFNNQLMGCSITSEILQRKKTNEYQHIPLQ